MAYMLHTTDLSYACYEHTSIVFLDVPSKLEKETYMNGFTYNIKPKMQTESRVA